MSSKKFLVAVLLSGFTALLTLVLPGCGASSQPISVGLTPSSTQNIDQGQTVPAITASTLHDTTNAGVTWTVSGGGTLSAQTTTSATYNAPASVTSGFTATVTAASKTDTTKSATLQIKVSPLPAVSTTSLAAATAGTAYSATLGESGGTSPYTWSITAGSLPAGLTFNTSTGAISGTPTGAGNGNSVIFKVTDSSTAAKMSASQSITFAVNPAPPLTITTSSLPAGTMGTAYSQTLQGSGGVPSYTWSKTAGSLPAGLTLSSMGVISGTPTGTFTGTSNFTVTLTDSQTPASATKTANLSITMSAPPFSVTTTTLAGGTIGNVYTNQTLQATGGISPYTWAVTTGSLPAGLSLNASTGVISGTPSGTFVGTDSFTVTATDSETPTAKTASATLSIAISVAPLSVTTTSSSLPLGVVSSVYAGATLQATGGITPYSWAVTTGSLPAGLVLNSATGAISGTPTASGTVNFTVTVTDSETPTAKTATANLSIVVNPAVSVTTTSLPGGVIGTAYPGATLQAAGGITPYTWAVTTGSLPAGLSLNANTGAITGTPSGTFTGPVNFTVTVTDNESPTKKTATANLSITISAPPLSVTTTSLAGGSIGNAYTNQTLQATGGISPYTWAVTTGSLPAGLSLNASTGVISGTPSGTFVGTDSFTVTATDSETPTAKTASATLSIAISVAPLSVTTTSSSLPLGVVSSVYAGATLQATGGITPYSWAVTTGSLPAGLVLNSATGAISGTPTASGTVNFTVTVTDSETPTAKTATANLSIVVNPAVSVTTTSLPGGVIGTAYPGATLQAAGGITPYTWAVTTGSLPAGLSLNANTGAITGTPSGTFTGPVNFTVTVTDNESPQRSAAAALNITISAPAFSVTTTTLAGGTIGNAYTNQTLRATGGIAPYTWAVTTGSLPAGLSLNASTGVISGTPSGTFVGTDSFTVTATDSETPTHATATANLSITITVAALSVTTTSGSLPLGVVSTVYPGATLQATGGIQPYSWAVTTGSLPAGLSLNPSTGAISGTPTASGTVNFTVTVTDSETPTAKTATANLSIVVNPAVSVTTTSLPGGVIGTAYPGATLQAAGGVTPYTWAVTTGSLPAGLSLNTSTGAISGTPSGTFVGPVNFTVTVTDNESPTKKTATANLSITISVNTLTVTTTTASLPTGVINNFYSATLQASGGVMPYTWSQTGGTLPAGLTLNSNGTISGTPTALGTASFTVQVKDSETPTAQTASASLSISINNSAPLMVTTTSSQLPAGNTGYAYPSTSLQATGGVQPYTWSYTGNLPTGLSMSAGGTITGTPSAAGTFNFTAKVTDSSSPTPGTATAGLQIVVTTPATLTLPPSGALANATINQNYSGAINASGGIGPYSFSVNGSAVPTDGTNVPLADGLYVSNTGGNTLSIGGTPTATGTVTLTNVTVTDSASHSAGPDTYTIAVINPSAVYTISGTVSYSGSKTGWTYLQLNGNNCGGCGNNLGTSIATATPSGVAFIIHGVSPGTYTLQAFMDNLGYGGQNASNPVGSVANVTVTTSSVTGVSVTLGDPAAVTISSAPSWNSSNGLGAFSGGALISYQTIQNNNGIEIPASYTIQWSTSSTFATVTGSTSFAATGRKNPWIVNGLTNGNTYYFRAQGVAGSSTGPFSAISPGVLIGAPTGANTVSGQVTFSETAKGPLYAGFYDQSTGNFYAAVVGSKALPPTSPASYTVHVPTGSNYFFFGILDQNNSGLIDAPGQVSNTNGSNAAPVVINGNLTNENLTLPSGNAVATVNTQNQEVINGTTTYNYSIGLNVNGLIKLPVGVELTAESNPGAVIPVDIATGAFSGNRSFSYYTSLNGATPKVGDTYTLHVTYSDGNSEDLIATIGAVLNAFATGLSPQGTGVRVQPNFSWTDPANASSYTYQFSLCCDQNGTIWQIPANDTKSNGFSSSITSITWNVDPLGTGNLPNVSSLNGGTYYNWQIQASDANNNSAQVQVSFQTATTPLSLPAAGSLGTTTVGQNFNGVINASGGVPGYSFTVNGNTIPGDGSQQSVTGGDGLWVSNNGGNTLTIGGTPTAVQTVTLNVSVTDSTSASVGPIAYTVSVIAGAPLSFPATSLPGGNNGWAYSTYLKAKGGVQPYTWSVISGSLPAGLSIDPNSGNISGTPTATGTASFTVQVADSESPPATASQTLSIAIANCSYTALNGHYAFLSNGWKGATEANSAVGSFSANGAGAISGGLLDLADQAKAPQESITFTGTYCGASDNLIVINLTPTGGGSATFAATLDSTGNGHIMRYDGTSSDISSGLLRKQQTTAFSTGEITGNYAFGLVGADQGSNRFAVAGELTANGSASFSGEADYDSGCSSGSCSGNVGNTTLSSSNFNVASTGRGTASISFTGPGATINMVFYVVNSSEMLMMAVDAPETPPMIIAGQVLKQSGSLTDASLNGNSVIEVEGLDLSSTPAVSDAETGIINANGSGSFSGTLDDNDGGTVKSQAVSGSYAVTPSTGRVTLSGAGKAPVFYLIGTNQAFVVGTDNLVIFGMMQPQTGSSFTNALLTGNYYGGSQPPASTNVSTEADQLHADGAGTLTGTSDNNSNCGSGSACPNSSTIAGTYAVASNGRVVVSQGGTQVGIMYIISTSQAVFLGTTDNNPKLDDFHQ